MLRHIYFNLIYVRGRLSTWIMLALLTIMCTAIYIVFPGIFDWETTVDVTISTSFLLLALLFVGVTKALNIFKDSETNGMELIIVSKPITRSMVIGSKFISLIIVLLFYTFSQLPIIMIGTIMYKSSFIITYLNFFFLCFFITIFFAAVTTLLALVFGTLGSLAFSSLIGTVLILFTFLLPTLLKIGSTDKDSKLIGNSFSNNYIVDNKYTSGGFPDRIVYNFDKDNENYNYIWQPKSVLLGTEETPVSDSGLKEIVSSINSEQDNIKFYLGDVFNIGRSFNSLITLFSNQEYKESYPIDYATKYLKLDNFEQINSYYDHLKYVKVSNTNYKESIDDYSVQLNLAPPFFGDNNGGFFTKAKQYGQYVSDATKDLFKKNNITQDFYNNAIDKLSNYKNSIQADFDSTTDKDEKIALLTKFTFMGFLDYYFSGMKINEKKVAEDGLKLFLILTNLTQNSITENKLSEASTLFKFGNKNTSYISIIDNSWLKLDNMFGEYYDDLLPIEFKKENLFNSSPVSLDQFGSGDQRISNLKFWYSYSFSIDSLIQYYGNEETKNNYDRDTFSLLQQERNTMDSDLRSYSVIPKVNGDNNIYKDSSNRYKVINPSNIEIIKKTQNINPMIYEVFHSGIRLSISNKENLKNLDNSYRVYKYELNDYINSNYSVIIVLVINILTFGTSIIIYYRRDFK